MRSLRGPRSKRRRRGWAHRRLQGDRRPTGGVTVECRFFGPFREATGAKRVEFEPDAGTYRELLATIEARYPDLEGELLVPGGEDLAGDTVVSKNGRDVRHLDGLDTPVEDGDVVRLVPSVYGGDGRPTGATHVHVLLYDGFDELDAIGPYEVFDYAREFGALIVPSYRTLEPRERITASHGTRIVPDGTLPDPSEPDAPDLIVVPGGGWNARDEGASAWVEAKRGDVPRALAAHHRAGARVAGVCTGGMLLATAGLVDGRPAVTHASALEELRDSGAVVRDARVVDDGDVLTAGGVTSGLDLALHVVERHAGAELADRIATVVEYDRRFDVEVTG
ncbi:MAG: ubiquitin-like small modifier protein 1 [Haloferacaceae archaeon]